MTLEAICCSSQKKVGCKNSAGWLGSTSLSFWVQPWGWFYKRDKVSSLLSECPWTVVRVKGKELMQIDSQSFLFPYSNGKKLFWKALFFREWLMVVGWAQVQGSFLCLQFGWCLGLSRPVMETPSEVLSNSQGPRHHSTSGFCRPCHQELKREADAAQSVLNCSPWQAKFSSLFEMEFEEPCLIFLFIWANKGAFAQKPGSKMVFQLTSETY